MAYNVKLISRPEREARIQKAVDACEKRENFDFFRDEPIELPVVRLPIDLPVYRMENFRTFSDQAEYLAREGKAADFFRSGQENESAQQIQHELLARLASKGVADSVVPVIDVLRREGQREKLLITRRGIVVNGNRRLAAMRVLLNSEPPIASFSHVNCVVLPADATADDILEIEAVLQARPETRLDYDWVGDAQLLAAMRKIRGSAEAVAKKLGRKAPEVRNALQALNEADIYLKDWANAPGQYSKVADEGEQLFKDLSKLIADKAPAMQDASRAIAWSLFDNRKKLDGRIYAYNVTFGKRAEDVLERLSDETGIATVEDSGADGGTFDFELDTTGATTVSYQPLIQALKHPKDNESVVEKLIEICGGIIESERDKASGNAALKAISTANAKLAEVDLTRASPTTFDAISKQLATITQRAGTLTEKLSALAASKTSANVSEGG